MTVSPGGTFGSTPGASVAAPSAPTTAHSSGRRPVAKAVLPSAGLWLREYVEGAPRLGAVA